ncbi:MAG: adenylosuccinate lyase [Coxiellaceae bacterium]|nr:adenylosuccinate lyase [Coxiellaceae bacterium]
MLLSSLTAISPLDGRYGDKTAQLRQIVSEYGLIYYRLTVEIHWLFVLSNCPEIKEFSPLNLNEKTFLEKLLVDFSEKDALAIKAIEKKTNHDVKAVEYFLRDQCESHPTLKHASSFIHFGATSEDINNLAYALMQKTLRDQQLLPALKKIIQTLNQLAENTAALPMLARTHGQPATPTTLGKEYKNFSMRLQAHVSQWSAIPIVGKYNGAVGNFNAHVTTYPAVDWTALSQHFIESLGLQNNTHTTQIEPHDFLAQWLNALSICHTILIDLCRDTWGYISLNYFSQKKSEHEVGSSTMPHKINPIDFENAEGNLGMAIALSTHLSQKLPISRWQRDLSDSTVLRNLGSVAGYALVAYQSIEKGLSKLIPNESYIRQELNAHPEVLTEAIQSVMRRYGIENAYEQLKQLSRGEKITLQQLRDFIETLSIPADEKQRLKTLTPENYLGLAVRLAK